MVIASAIDCVNCRENSRSTQQTKMLFITPDVPRAPPPPGDVNIGPVLVTGLIFTALVLVVVAVGIPWYKMEQFAAGPNGEDITETFHLWKTVKMVGNSKKIEMTKDISCPAVRNRVVGMQALSIITSFFLLIAAIMSVRNYRVGSKNASIRKCTIASVGVSFVALTVYCSLNFSVFHQTFRSCGEDGLSYHRRLYYPYVGFGFTVSGWVITAVAGIFSYADPRVPKDAHFVEFSRKAYALLSFASLLFAVVACPISHWYYKSQSLNRLTDVLLWKEQYSILWETNGATNSTFTRDLGCKSIIGSFYAAEVLSIVSVCSLAGSSLIGFLLCKNLSGSIQPSILFGFIASLVTCVQWVLELNIYYGSFCDGKYAYSRQMYILTSGFALTVISFVVILLATIILSLGEVLRRKHYVSKFPSRSMKEIAIEMIQ